MSGSARIVRATTAVPAHRFTQDRAKEMLGRWLDANPTASGSMSRAKATRLFDNAGVAERYSSIEIEELLDDVPLDIKNRRYMESAIQLSEEVVRKLFDGCYLGVEDVDLIITTSCTGFMIPALDAYLINSCGFRSNVRRLPVTELGCAAGVAAIRMAGEFIQGRPNATVLIVATELATLTFQPSDFTGAHIVSCAIFGDGAAGVIVTGRDLPGFEIKASGSHFFPNTLDFMGYDLRKTGFHIFLSPKIPEFIKSDLMPRIKDLLADDHQEKLKWLVHPGGAKILNAVEDALDLPRGGLMESRSVLRRVGNLSSATIFFILENYMHDATRLDGEHSALLAVGPGFSMEYSFLQWKGN